MSDKAPQKLNLIEIYIDGASKGNPGEAGVGVVIKSGAKILKNISEYIGHASNNFAEYSALIYALEEALILKAPSIRVKTDSQLLARQISGEYKIKNQDLKILYNQAKRLLSGFKKYEIINIPRELNKEADRLASLAVVNKKASHKESEKAIADKIKPVLKNVENKKPVQLELF